MKFKIFYLLTIITQVTYGQMAVVDAGVNTTLASQLATSSSQLAQMQSSYELLQASAEKIEKVSNMVKSINNMGEIISLQKEAINNVNIIMKSPKANGESLNNINNALVSISANINIISKLLSNGLFNMTDKERIDFFEDKRQRILIDVVKTRIMKNRYQ